VLPCSWFKAFENKWPTLAPTSGELTWPPSSCRRRSHRGQGLHYSHWMSIKKRYAKLGARKGRLPLQHPRRSWTKKSGTLKPFINRSKRRKKDASSRWSSEEDWWGRWGNASSYPRWPRLKASIQTHNDDEWYDDFDHGNFAFDDASPLAAELQATPWPPSYKLPQLFMYDGHSDPKQFLMSYEATILLGLCFVAEGLIERSNPQMKLFVQDSRRCLFAELRHYKPT
jgi:hypothetical protein